jgi:sulfur carrier protein
MVAVYHAFSGAWPNRRAPSVLSSGVMVVTVNGSEKDVPEGLSVRALLDHLGLTEGPVAVEINREIVPRAEHATRPVSKGDVLEIVHFVGGG